MIAREEEIKVLKKVEVEIVDDIYQMIAKNETLLKKYDVIISIDGIGKIAAIVLIHLFIRYANQRQITSLVGLDPVMRESGTSIKGKSRISKAGGKMYRGSLFMAAMVATKHNKSLKLFYIDLKKMENTCPERSEEILLGCYSSSNSGNEKTCDYRSLFI